MKIIISKYKTSRKQSIKFKQLNLEKSAGICTATYFELWVTKFKNIDGSHILYFNQKKKLSRKTEQNNLRTVQVILFWILDWLKLDIGLPQTRHWIEACSLNFLILCYMQNLSRSILNGVWVYDFQKKTSKNVEIFSVVFFYHLFQFKLLHRI